MGDCTFVVGESFSFYTDFQAKIKVYEAKNSVQLFCRYYRTLNAASRRVPKRVMGANKDVLFSLHFACVFADGKDWR